MKRKFLFVSAVALFLAFATAIVACEPYEKPEEEKPGEYSPTYAHTVRNGTFYDAKTSSAGSKKDEAVLDKVDGWSQSNGSISTSSRGSDGAFAAAIDLANETAFDDVAKKYLNVSTDSEGKELENKFVASNPGVDPKTPMTPELDDKGKPITDEQDRPKLKREDTNAMVVASTRKEASLYASSAEFTLQKDSRYLLQYSVCSRIDNAAKDENKGARVVVTDGEGAFWETKNIDTDGKWVAYYLFVETRRAADMKLKIELWLGYGPAAKEPPKDAKPEDKPKDDGKGRHSTRGVAFFDNVICEKVKDCDFAKAVTEKEKGEAETEPMAIFSCEGYEPPSAGEGEAKEIDAHEAHERFAAFASKLKTEKDGRGNARVAATSAYFVENADMRMRRRPRATSDSDRKHFYTFFGKNESSNLVKHSKPSDNNVSAKEYGIADLALLYGEGDDPKCNYDDILDFCAPSHKDWKEKIMPRYADGGDARALMLYNKELRANVINIGGESAKIKAEPNALYEISVWAYVWAKTYSVDGRTLYYDPEKNSKNSPPTEEKFIDKWDKTADRHRYGILKNMSEKDELKDEFGEYLKELTDDEKAKRDAKTKETLKSELTDDKIAFDESESLKSGEKAWLREILGLGDEVGIDDDLARSFFYTYLSASLDDQIEDVKAKKTEIDAMRLYERGDHRTWFKEKDAKVKEAVEKREKWEEEEKEYQTKHENWQNRNEMPRATLKLTGAGDGFEQKTDKLNEWQQLKFHIRGGQISARQFGLQAALGFGKDEKDWMIGGAFFDDVEVREWRDAAEATEATKVPAEEWTRLGEIPAPENMSFGGLTGETEEVSEATKEATKRDWKIALGKDTAKGDADKATVEAVSEGALSPIKVGDVERRAYVLKYEHSKPTSSVLEYAGADPIEIKPNKRYRFAFLIKTEGIDEEKGVKISLTHGESKDDISKVMNSDVTKYSNATNEWKEIAYYIRGDLFETFYVGLKVAAGEGGTRFDTDKYVEGKVLLTAFNCVEIDYEEYSDASTGDKIVKNVSPKTTTPQIESDKPKFSNSTYAKIDEKTPEDEFDENGKLTGIGKTKDWSTTSVKANEYDKPTKVELDKTEKKLKWNGSKGVTSDESGKVKEADPEWYEIWMRYVEKGKEKEKFYDRVAVGDDNSSDKVCEYAFDDWDEWASRAKTEFAVRAAGADGASEKSAYAKLSLGGGESGIEIPKPRQAESARMRAGTAAVENEPGLFDGEYASPYKTVMKLTGEYDYDEAAKKFTKSQKGIISIKSGTISGIDLEKDKYYKISVWAKTTNGAKISITLDETTGALQASTDDNKLGFVNVSTDGKWQEFRIYMATENFAPSMRLRYSLGNPYAKKRAGRLGGDEKKHYALDDLSAGTAYFDAVRAMPISKSEYERAVEADESKGDARYGSLPHEILHTGSDARVYCMQYVMDSFDATDECTEKNGKKVKHYSRGYDSDLSSGDEFATYGVYNYGEAETDEKMRSAIESLYLTDKNDEKKFAFNEAFKDTLKCESWAEDDWDAFMKKFLSITRKDGDAEFKGGNNVLVMSNKSKSGYAQHYSLNDSYKYKIESGKCAKIMFSARSLLAEATKKETTAEDGTTKEEYEYNPKDAYAEMRISPDSGKDDVVSVKISSKAFGNPTDDDPCPDVTYAAYLRFPVDENASDGDKKTRNLKWEFYFGDEIAKESDDGEKSAIDPVLRKRLIGLLAIDLVSVEEIDEAEYEAGAKLAGANGTTYKYEYPLEEKEKKSDDGDEDKDEEKPEEPSLWEKIANNEYFWLYISSFVIALVIIITVVAVLINRFKKRHPAQVVGESKVKPEKEIEAIARVPQTKEEPLESDKYVDSIPPRGLTDVRRRKKPSRRERKGDKR